MNKNARKYRKTGASIRGFSKRSAHIRARRLYKARMNFHRKIVIAPNPNPDIDANDEDKIIKPKSSEGEVW